MTATRTAGRHARRAALAVGLAALLVVPSGGPASSDNELEVAVAPTAAGDTAVHDEQTVTVSGSAPAGALETARLIGYRADGSVLGVQEVDRYTLNAEDPGPGDPVNGGGGDFLRNDDGTLSGRLTLFCLFGDPSSYTTCTERGAAAGEVRSLRLEVAVAGVTAASAPLRVDYTRPRLAGAELVGTTSVRARFSEPVRKLTGTPDTATDWVVTAGGTEVPVSAVEGSRPGDCAYGPGDDATAGADGCSRTLRLLTPVDEDAALTVRYVPDVDYRLPVRTTYEDFASNRALTAEVPAVDAADRIRPPLPTIDSVAGRPAAERVAANDPTPALVVSGVRAGHSALVRITSGGTTTETAPAASDGSPLTLQLPSLGADGDHRLEVVAVDPTGNRSTDSTSAARPDGGPSAVTYGLDTVAPALLGALAESDGTLTVALSEPVAGADAPGDWSLASGRRVTGVSGSGALRQLTVDGGAVAGDRLTYRPTGDRYADRAGNAVADRTLVVSGVPAPVVTAPLEVLFTKDRAARVTGTGRDGDVVELFSDGDRDGTPDGAPVATADVVSGAWAADVPVAADTRTDLLAQARQGEGRSPFATVAGIVQDSTAPRLAVVAPGAGAVLAGGSRSDVEWTTSDAHHGDAAAVRVELDAGDGFAVLDPAAPASAGRTTVTVPARATDTAVVRLTTRDLAGNETVALSAPFRIDTALPVFATRTTAPREVEVLFSEPVYGPLGADWRVAGQPAAVASADGERTARADGVTRLVLATTADFDPDSEPEVVYAPSLAALTGELVDAAGQGVPVGRRSDVAVDGIRPAAPTVETVAGRPAGSDEVLASDGRPVVSVSGVRSGNDVLVEVATAGAALEGPRTTASGATADATSPALPADGPYRLRAVAVDPTGNRSTTTELRAPARDGDAEVTYVLDRLVPVAVAADPQGDDVRVAFSEPVSGPDAPADWTFTAPGGAARAVTAVSGRGDARVLQVDGGAASGGTLRYAPTGARYADAAGNAVGDTTLVVGGVPVPVVVTPSVPRLTKDASVVVEGVAEPGTAVELLRDGSDAVVDRREVGRDGRWTVTSPLQRDADNRLLVRAVDPASSERSSTVPVPVITQDGTAPALELREPTGGEVLAGGADAVVRWATSDAHSAPDGMRVEITLDGRSFTVLEAAAAPGDAEGSVEYVVPDTSADAARVRVTATDLAGNATSVLSEAFRIDALHPRFAARTVGDRSVLVRFTEPVGGTIAPSDFLVGGAPALVESTDTGGSSLRAAGVRELRLRTAGAIGPNDRPLVVYAPTPAGEARDDAGNGVEERQVTALDGIAPAAPRITSPEGTAYEAQDRRTYTGSSEDGASVQLLAEDGAAASGWARAAADGSWTAAGQLRRDAAVVLRAVAVDDAGNASALTTAPTVVQDSTAPAVRVRAPQRGAQLPLDSDVDVAWTASDANLAARSVVVEVTTDGGQTWSELGRERDGEGRLTWRTPSEPTSTAAVRVRALDLAGRTGAATEGFFGIGRPAAAGSPQQAAPPLAAGPVTGAVDAEITVRERVLGALPRTGTDLLGTVLFGLATLLTGLGLLVAGRNHRRRRAA